jgi:hypothetical protein
LNHSFFASDEYALNAPMRMTVMAFGSLQQWWTTRIEAGFKPLPEGWLFAAPNPWLFGARRNYILSETQRAQAVAIQKRATLVGLVIGLLVGAVVLGLPRLFPELQYPLLKWPALVLAVLSASIVNTRSFLHRLRPILASAQPTTEKLGMQFQLSAIASFYPTWVWTTLCVVCSIVVLVSSTGIVLWTTATITGWNPPADWDVSNAEVISLSAVCHFAAPLTFACFLARKSALAARHPT